MPQPREEFNPSLKRTLESVNEIDLVPKKESHQSFSYRMKMLPNRAVLRATLILNIQKIIT